MKAMVVQKWGEKSVLMSRPDPKPGPREAVMRVRAAGVGLTLLNMRNGSFGGEAPRIMGHELGGDIVEVGSDVTEVKVGDRCAVYFYLTCHRCRWCRGGRETLCEAFKGFVGVHRDGGYAEYVSLPVENFLHIPQGLSYEAAAMATDAVNTNWHCMKERARINPHDRVLLIGAGGGVGIHGVQVAKAFGAQVIAMDVSDEKLDLARQWGADYLINVKHESDLVAAVKKLTDGAGVDAAIDYVGHAQTFQVAFDSLTTSGRAVVIGVGKGDIAVPTRPLMLSEKIVTGSRHSTRTELIETLEVMARGIVKPVIGMRTHFTEIESIFDAIVSEKLLGRGALTYD
ncbi:MAG: zinc-binding dehydrogenase [Betaproteobacteria bacterium]|nr:zinc-binding dehydrogenase [Betaproteobacteria bacterium]